MKLAKPLEACGSPLPIITESAMRRGRMVEQLPRSVDREASRAARSLARSPKHDKLRKKLVDVEGERVTCREASIVLRVNGECRMIPPGSEAVARVYGNCINLGDLPRTREGLPDQLTEVRYCAGRSQTRSSVKGHEVLRSTFFNAARHTIYRALNNRSQKKSYSWQGFTAMWKTLDIPNPKIIESAQPWSPCLIR